VAPANTLPALAMDNNIPVILINLGETPFDDYVTLHVSAPCGLMMQQVMDELDKPSTLNSDSVLYYSVLRK